MPLCAVQGDPNSHGGGELIAENPQTVFINNIPVIDHAPDPAQADSYCPAPGHCNPETAEGSPNVFYYFNPVHRMLDSRVCGATTVVELQYNVFANDGAPEGQEAAAPIDNRIPIPIDPINPTVLTAVGIGYSRAIVSAAFDAGVPKSQRLPYGADDAKLKDAPVTLNQTWTASLNYLDDIIEQIGVKAYVPYSNISSGPFTTTEITPEALAATQLSYTKELLDLAKQKGIYKNSDRIPFAEKTTPGFESTNVELTDKQNLIVSMNYLDKIVNSPPLVEKLPVWPRLPFGDNNGNT